MPHIVTFLIIAPYKYFYLLTYIPVATHSGMTLVHTIISSCICIVGMF